MQQVKLKIDRLTFREHLSGLGIVGSSAISPLGVFVTEYRVWIGKVIRQSGRWLLDWGLLDVGGCHCDSSVD